MIKLRRMSLFTQESVPRILSYANFDPITQISFYKKMNTYIYPIRIHVHVWHYFVYQSSSFNQDNGTMLVLHMYFRTNKRINAFFKYQNVFSLTHPLHFQSELTIFALKTEGLINLKNILPSFFMTCDVTISYQIWKIIIQ